jgi:hypothetical protein
MNTYHTTPPGSMCRDVQQSEDVKNGSAFPLEYNFEPFTVFFDDSFAELLSTMNLSSSGSHGPVSVLMVTFVPNSAFLIKLKFLLVRVYIPGTNKVPAM